MPKILLNVSDGQKELWVAAAHDERLSLSEWIRRRCDGALTAGVPQEDGVAPRREGSSGFESQSAPRSEARVSRPPAVSAPYERVFRPDPKGGKK